MARRYPSVPGKAPRDQARRSPGHPTGGERAAPHESSTLPPEPRVDRADRAQVRVEMVLLETDAREGVLPLGVRQPAEGEPEGDEDRGRVVELTGHRDDARHEIDGRYEVNGAGDQRRTTGGRQSFVAAEAEGEASVARQPAQERGEPIARKRIRRRGAIGRIGRRHPAVPC